MISKAVSRKYYSKHKRIKSIEKVINAGWNGFSEYSERSTIHGVRYLGEKQRHWTERTWWLFSFVISIILCSKIIHNSYLRWSISPIMIQFANKATPISKIPFPTITICANLKALPDMLNYSNIFDQLSQEGYEGIDLDSFDIKEVQYMHALSSFCEMPKHLDDYIKLKNVPIVTSEQGHMLEYDLRMIGPNLFDSDRPCYLPTGERFDCYLAFRETITDDGLCYVFNHKASDKIFTDKLAYSFHTPKPYSIISFVDQNRTSVDFSGYLRRAGKGIYLEFSMSRLEYYFDKHCGDIVEGLKISINSANDIPQVKRNFYHIPFGQDINLMLRPNIITTERRVIKNYEKNIRKCIAKNDNELVFFKKYTQTNCYLDVLAIETVKKCGCALHWMPRLNETIICRSYESHECAWGMDNFIETNNLTDQCLPACYAILYEAELSTTTASKYLLTDWSKSVRIHICFKNEQYVSMRRSELYGRTDFLADCGGILGLFMGVSILSIVEIFYSATLRIFCNRCKQKQLSTRADDKLTF